MSVCSWPESAQSSRLVLIILDELVHPPIRSEHARGPSLPYLSILRQHVGKLPSEKALKNGTFSDGGGSAEALILTSTI
jgi:hypothetical protein